MSIDRPNSTQLAALAAQLGFPSAAAAADEYISLVDAALSAYDDVEQRTPDRAAVAYRRTTASEDPGNAWFLRAEITGADHGPLARRTIAGRSTFRLRSHSGVLGRVSWRRGATRMLR